MQDIPKTNKSLGQHWLNDPDALSEIIDSAALRPDDTVLEIGPGPGSLTERLLVNVQKVIAVELDQQLASRLRTRFPADKLEVVRQDILQFDLTELPPQYKVVANIPYYLTSNLIRVLSETNNPPEHVVLLIQKEVAQRLAAQPGNLSILGVSAQYYWHVHLGSLVPASLFIPPPKVDSQIVSLTRREVPLFPRTSAATYFRIVKAGFAQKRKTILNGLSAGLGIDKPTTQVILTLAHVEAQARPQTLSLEAWQNLAKAYNELIMSRFR